MYRFQTLLIFVDCAPPQYPKAHLDKNGPKASAFLVTKVLPESLMASKSYEISDKRV